MARSRLAAVLELGRVSNLPSVISNVVAAWVLAGAPAGVALLPLAAGAVLLYLAGTTLNDAVDARFDRAHRPERPIPAGVLSRRSVWLLGAVYLCSGVIVLLGATAAQAVWVGSLAAAIVLYDVVHKRWKGAVLVMGACRLLLYMMAASAAVGGGGALHPPVLLWAAATFLYIVGLTLAARGESTGGGVPHLAVALLAAPLAAAAAAAVMWGVNAAAALCFLILAAWIVRCWATLRGERPDRVGRFVGGLLAGIPLIDAMAVAALAPWLAIALLLGLPVSLVLQRAVAAT